jgi:MFS family permease
MVRAGLIGAIIGFIYGMSLTLLSPFCTLCFTPLLGLSVGYLASAFDKPTRLEASLGRGSIAGGIAGGGVIVGQILAVLVNGILMTNIEDFSAFMSELGVPSNLVIDPTQYWQGTLIAGSFCGALNLMIIIGLAALGSQLWFRRQQQINALTG